MNGKQVRLYLVDGTVGGLMTAEILNWTGHMLRARRKDLARLKNREEAQRTGVYVLFGTNEDGEPAAYIGEGDNVIRRLENHNARKDFWEDVVIITSKDMNLTKAHVRYLESELIRLAKSIGRTYLYNSVSPTGGAALPEADQSDMHYFITQIRILMPVLGFDIFRGRTTPLPAAKGSTAPVAASPTDEATESSDSPVFYIKNQKGADAQAQLIDGEFTLLAGSIIPATMKDNPDWSDTTRKQFAKRQAQHATIVEASTPGPTPDLVQLLKDVVFTSPSAAGAIVYGSASTNGRIAWKTKTGQTLGDWEEGQETTTTAGQSHQP
ncbi:GIY-YIG nuclease family protein [Corynebacterium sp. TAE3-ERU30]|uniref:GIY-YIG nuclease family protein n=1 Tax=Corynebacterium sp. TAE3-ERU30 TaxID=2849496 RepID=UPI001C46321B|nr:GIY-YIG nuclease family protein [Corynebacterium sp. TAE3-ERU30]MBV7282443.1 GIY-YIG nuclease family protein [Corynebacterium sp. TAE3-ERU30]